MTPKDPAAWAAFISSNAEDTDKYSRAVYDYTLLWADLAEDMLNHGAAFGYALQTSSFDATEDSAYEITINQHQYAVSVLVIFWIHGEGLRVWHNKRWGAPDAPEDKLVSCAHVDSPAGKTMVISPYLALKTVEPAALQRMALAGASLHYLKEAIEHEDWADFAPTGPYECPNCREVLRESNPARGGKHVPVPGDLSICTVCGTVSRYSKTLDFVALSTADLEQFFEEDQNLVIKVAQARRRILELRKQ